MKYLYIVVIATRVRQFIFFLYFFSKNCENNGKISVLIILVLLTNFLFCHRYVTMPNVSLNLV